MSKRRTLLGAWGERKAARHLKRRGYRVIARNLRTRQGEIDLLVVSPDGALVFVEVRTVSSPWGVARAVDTVDLAKQRQVVRAARAFLATRAGRRLSEGRSVRFDAVGVDARIHRIEHVVDAFRAPEEHSWL